MWVWNSYKDMNEIVKEISVECPHYVRTSYSLSGGKLFLLVM